MVKSYLGLGTNIGNKRRNLIKAAVLLAERAGDVMAISSFYETDPVGFQSDHRFLNAALCLETACSPLELLEMTQAIEREMGRTSKSVDGVYKDRIIDIDILLYGTEVISMERLTLPHPLMQDRAFVMAPLAEIAPMVIHPVSGKTMQQILEEIV